MVGVEGFQIKHAINTNELSKGQIEEIKNGYNEGKYERTPRGFENWLKRNGHSERLRNSDSIDVEVRESIIDNARLDSEAPQGESFREPSSSNSQEDRRKSTRLSKTGANGTMFPRFIEVPDIVSLITSLTW